MYPYSSLRVTDFGLRTFIVDFSPKRFSALESTRMSSDLPQPAGPMRKTDQRTTRISRNCEAFSTNVSPACKLTARAASTIFSSKSVSRDRTTSSRVFGNKSSIIPTNMLTSSATSLPRLKSRRARSSTLSSELCRSSRSMPPATLSVVLTARNFQS